MEYAYEETKYIVIDAPRGVILQEMEPGMVTGTIHPVHEFDTKEEAILKAKEIDPEFEEEERLEFGEESEEPEEE